MNRQDGTHRGVVGVGGGGGGGGWGWGGGGGGGVGGWGGGGGGACVRVRRANHFLCVISNPVSNEYFVTRQVKLWLTLNTFTHLKWVQNVKVFRNVARRYQNGDNLSLILKCICIRKSKDYVYDIWLYKVLGIWKGYYKVKITSFMHETVNKGKE